MKEMPFLQVYTTARCNSGCRHCFLAAKKNKKPVKFDDEISTELMIDYISTICSAGTRLVAIGGAEPTQRKSFNEIINRLAEMDCFVKLHTNGMSISKNRARILRNARVFEVRISLDGSTPQINDWIRGQGTYRRIITGINNCIEADVPVTIAVTLSKQNINDLNNIISLGNSLGVSAIHSYLLIDKGRGNNLTRYILDDYEKQKAHAIFDLARKSFDAIDKPSKERCLCKNGSSYLSLRQDGKLRYYTNSRAAFGEGILDLGDMSNEETINRAQALSEEYKIVQCDECPYFGTLQCIELDNYCFDDIYFQRSIK